MVLLSKQRQQYARQKNLAITLFHTPPIRHRIAILCHVAGCPSWGCSLPKTCLAILLWLLNNFFSSTNIRDTIMRRRIGGDSHLPQKCFHLPFFPFDSIYYLITKGVQLAALEHSIILLSLGDASLTPAPSSSLAHPHD